MIINTFFVFRGTPYVARVYILNHTLPLENQSHHTPRPDCRVIVVYSHIKNVAQCELCDILCLYGLTEPFYAIDMIIVPAYRYLA